MQVSPSSFAITGLGAVPPWAVNAGIIIGAEKTLIIDTGANWLAAQTIYGYATALCPANEIVVFNCEPHFDHIGGNGYFHDQGIAIYGHPNIQRTPEQLRAEKGEYNDSIVNPIRNGAREAEAFFVNTTVANPIQAASAGYVFELGNVTAEVLATPGHTAINQSIYNRSDNILFCADCIVTDYIPNLEAGSETEWQRWLDSLTLIEALAPDAIIPGHGRVMRGVEIREQIVRMRGFVDTAIADGTAPTA